MIVREFHKKCIEAMSSNYKDLEEGDILHFNFMGRPKVSVRNIRELLSFKKTCFVVRLYPEDVDLQLLKNAIRYAREIKTVRKSNLVLVISNLLKDNDKKEIERLSRVKIIKVDYNGE